MFLCATEHLVATMKKYSFLIICILAGFFRPAFGQEGQPMADPTDFFNKLRQISSTTKTIKADFTEEKFLSYLKEPAKSTGVFYYKKEKKLRWEKLKPTPYIFLVNGDKAKIKDNNKEKDISSFNEAVGRIKDLIMILVNGEFQDNKLFRPVCYKNDKTYMVKLYPKNRRLAKIFDNIQLTFSMETLRLKEMDFFEKSGDKSTMKFYNDVINVNLEDQLFTNF